MAAVEMFTPQPTPINLSSRKFPMKMLCEMAGSILDVNGDLLEYIHLIKRVEYRKIWGKAYGNELGRLAQGIGDNIKGTDTICFTTKQNIPFERRRDITYGQIV